jgi:hypothetical protein
MERARKGKRTEDGILLPILLPRVRPDERAKVVVLDFFLVPAARQQVEK